MGLDTEFSILKYEIENGDKPFNNACPWENYNDIHNTDMSNVYPLRDYFYSNFSPDEHWHIHVSKEDLILFISRMSCLLANYNWDTCKNWLKQDKGYKTIVLNDEYYILIIKSIKCVCNVLTEMADWESCLFDNKRDVIFTASW